MPGASLIAYLIGDKLTKNVKSFKTKAPTKARLEYYDGPYSGKAVTITKKKDGCKAVVSVFDRGSEKTVDTQSVLPEVMDRLQEACEQRDLENMIDIPYTGEPGKRRFLLYYGPATTHIASNRQEAVPEVRELLDRVEAIIKQYVAF